MDDFANNTVRDIAVQCAAQSAKTQTVMNCACWAIAEDPGPAMWVTATKDELRDFLRDRLTPTFEDCPPVKARMAEPTLTGFAFDGMPFYAGWSGSKARLQSKPIRWLFLRRGPQLRARPAGNGPQADPVLLELAAVPDFDPRHQGRRDGHGFPRRGPARLALRVPRLPPPPAPEVRAAQVGLRRHHEARGQVALRRPRRDDPLRVRRLRAPDQGHARGPAMDREPRAVRPAEPQRPEVAGELHVERAPAALDRVALDRGGVRGGRGRHACRGRHRADVHLRHRDSR
jgi:hypothetical protein